MNILNFFLIIGTILEIILIGIFVTWLFKRLKISVFKPKNQEELKYNKKLRKNKKEFKKKYLIRFDALKFEYNTVYNVVTEEVNKINDDYVKNYYPDKVIISELYLIRLHENFQKYSNNAKEEFDYLIFFTSLWIALDKEPVFIDKSSTYNLSDTLNKVLIENVFKVLDEYYPEVTTFFCELEKAYGYIGINKNHLHK